MVILARNLIHQAPLRTCNNVIVLDNCKADIARNLWEMSSLKVQKSVLDDNKPQSRLV